MSYNRLHALHLALLGLMTSLFQLHTLEKDNISPMSSLTMSLLFALLVIMYTILHSLLIFGLSYVKHKMLSCIICVQYTFYVYCTHTS